MDNDLESAIDAVGRDNVFARARANGWGGNTPPKWVWWAIVNELAMEAAPPCYPNGWPSNTELHHQESDAG